MRRVNKKKRRMVEEFGKEEEEGEVREELLDTCKPRVPGEVCERPRPGWRRRRALGSSGHCGTSGGGWWGKGSIPETEERCFKG